MKKIAILMMLIWMSSQTFSQIDITYQLPDQAILDLADAPMPPSVRINSKGDLMLILNRNAYKSIEELSEKEMRLAGLRINPVTNISSRERFYIGISIQKVGDKAEIPVKGLPQKGRFSNFDWSPDESMMAFTNTTQKGVELWIIDLEKATAKQLTKEKLNANLGKPFIWNEDNKSMLAMYLPDDKQALIDKSNAIPTGPTVSVNDGKKAQNRTYQDLLQDKNDEYNFEQLARSDIYKVNIEGQAEPWLPAAMYRDLSFSPDGKYVMVTTIEQPFSYLVPYNRFPSTTTIYTESGIKVSTVLESPLIEDLPQGFMAVEKGRRNMAWRQDKPSTLFWAEALDGGDPEIEVEFRDEVFELEAPFNGTPKSLVKTVTRYAGINWGDDTKALCTDYWWNSRMIRTSLFNPSNSSEKPVLLYERNYQDIYSDPGKPVTRKNKYGMYVLYIDNDDIYLLGDGYSENGVYPFVDKFNLKTQVTERLWQAEENGTLESIVKALDMKKGLMLTRIESNTLFPNYYLRNIYKGTLEQITFIPNPFESIVNVKKEVIKYKRDDGLELSATLYLPSDYDTVKKEKLPMLMWAYPQEFKDKSSAGQVSLSPYEFTYPWYGSPIFWINRGYVVLDDAAFPIVGEGDEEPNDTFIPQLVSNAKAAIDAVNELGYIDPNRVAVGGHSYGAFMTANLLTHSDLFAAGIARSGAYNRTLTPFGFQSEERTYWEAPEIYYEMSPFMHADSMNTPLLLIHGLADNNSGTYPMQSERYFNALKGLGATVRLVMLPNESHGYAARESIMHMLWEQDEWLEKYVKNKE